MKKEKTYLERVTEFHKIYQEELFPILQKYETKRKRKLIVEILAIIVAAFSFFMGLEGAHHIREFFPQTSTNGIVLISFCSIIIGVICTLISISIPKLFTKEVKEHCLPIVLKAFPEVEWFSETNFIPDEELNKSGLFAHFNKRKSDDSFSGIYKNVDFKICETKLQRETYSSKSKRISTIFNGIIITFTANKNIKNRTIIATKGDNTAKNKAISAFGIIPCVALQTFETLKQNPLLYVFFITIATIIAIALFIKIKNTPEKGGALNDVMLEDPNFAKRFNVYSSDQVEARYLITTSFMERFQNLNTAFGAKKAKCSFYDDKIMFAITSSKNLFEISNFWESLENPKTINSLFAELYSVYQMINHFKLDQKTGL